MELLNWLTSGLTDAVAREDAGETKIFAIGLCPFTGSHWLVEDRTSSFDVREPQASRDAAPR